MIDSDETLIRIDERVESILKTVEDLNKVVIRGNGRPSLLSRVERLESGVQIKVAIVASLGALGTALANMLAG